jgi:hypothetical protein
MRKVVFMMSLLLTLGLFSACSNDGDVDNGMYVNEKGELVPIPIPEDGEVVKAIELPERHLWTEESHKVNLLCLFFNRGLPIGSRSNSFFVGSDKDECYVINSQNELKSIYCGNEEIPELLNFNKYTLVIGQKVKSTVFFPVLSQELEFFDKKCVLKLHVPALTAENTTDLPLYYWALYPKFKTEDISVKFVRERDAVKTVKDVYCSATKYNTFNMINPDEWKWGFAPYWRPGEDVLFASARIIPLNLSDKVNESNLVLEDDLTFSGEIVKMTEDAIQALGIEKGVNDYYFAYLNDVDVKEYVDVIPYRGTVPFTITDMPGQVGYDRDQQTYFIAYFFNYSQINPYYPEGDMWVAQYYPNNLSDDFKFNPEVEKGQKVIVSGNVYEVLSENKVFKSYKIELTKIEKAE